MTTPYPHFTLLIPHDDGTTYRVLKAEQITYSELQESIFAAWHPGTTVGTAILKNVWGATAKFPNGFFDRYMVSSGSMPTGWREDSG